MQSINLSIYVFLERSGVRQSTKYHHLKDETKDVACAISISRSDSLASLPLCPSYAFV